MEPSAPKLPPLKADPKKKKLSVAAQIRHKTKQEFLDAFAEYGTTYHTARAINVPLTTVYEWLKTDMEFAEAFKDVQRIPGYFVERAALKRARDEKSNADILRIFFLKNLLREKYGETDRLSIEIKIQETLVSGFVSLVQRIVPSFCPHCKTHLGLTDKLAKELMAMSERMSSTGGLGDPGHTAKQEVA